MVAAFWITLLFGGVWISDRIAETQVVEAMYVSTLFFGPLLVNALIFVRHQVDVDATQAYTPESRAM